LIIRAFRHYIVDSPRKTDVIVSPQASMARVLETMKPAEIHVPVLSSPRLGIQYMIGVLDRAEKKA